MSHAVLTGSATAAQRYVDGILRQVGRVDSLPAVLFQCMREHPEDVFMINGATGESFSNASLLARGAAGARALAARGAGRGARRACVLAANHEHLLATQLACLFAGVVPFGLDPVLTPFELEHFLKLWSPDVIFCDAACRAVVQQAVDSSCRDETPLVVTLDDGGYERFIAVHSQKLDDFQVAPPAADGVVALLPTSGSTGLPKAARITHRGLVAQLPSLWWYDTNFPSPVRRMGLLSSLQWMTWWNLVTLAPVMRITIVMTPRPVTPEVTVEIYRKYNVEWGLMSPAQATAAETRARGGGLSSVQRLTTCGSVTQPATLVALQELCAADAYVRQGYGMTELQGFSFVPDPSTPLKSFGRPLNIFQLKIVDENGKELGPNQKGELRIKSDICIFKGYLNNKEETLATVEEDGWLRTGDQVYKDENDYYYFVEKKKFWFKVNDNQVSPEELEAVVAGVRGVELVCVSGVRGGAAALVTCRAREEPPTREDIHRAVSKLGKHKHLTGGIAFVDSLPLTHSGKIKRLECREMLERLIEENKCSA